MSLFPWQDLFYHISQREAALTDEYNRYLTLCTNITANGAKFNSDLNTLRAMMLRNYALLIISVQCKMKESDYAQWLQDNHELSPATPQNSTVIQVMQGTADLIGLLSFGKMVWNLGKFVKGRYFSEASEDLGEESLDGSESVSESLLEPLMGDSGLEEASDVAIDEAGDIEMSSISEASAEAGVEAGTEAGIEATSEAVATASSAAMGAAASGVGIVVALGVDAILGAIEGSEESKQLDKEKAKLDKALSVTQDYSNKLNKNISDIQSKIVTQEDLFLNNIQLLAKIQVPTFPYKYEAIFDNYAEFDTAMALAVNEYGFLSTIRTNWINFQANAPQLGIPATWPSFQLNQELNKPANMKMEVAQGFFNYAKTKLVST